MSDLDDRLQKANQRSLATFDRDLQEFRLSYENMTESERGQVKDWLSQLVKLEEQCSAWPGVNIKIVVSHEFTDKEGQTYYFGSASFNPRVLLQAAECWESGQEFVPPTSWSII